MIFREVEPIDSLKRDGFRVSHEDIDSDDDIYTRLEFHILNCSEENLSSIKLLIHELMLSGNRPIKKSQVICRVICYDCPASSIMDSYLSKSINHYNHFKPTSNDENAIKTDDLLRSQLEISVLPSYPEEAMVFSAFRLELMFTAPSVKSKQCDNLLFQTFIVLHALSHAIGVCFENGHCQKRTNSKFESMLKVVSLHREQIIVPAVNTTILYALEKLIDSPLEIHIRYIFAGIEVLKVCSEFSEFAQVLTFSSVLDRILLKVLVSSKVSAPSSILSFVALTSLMEYLIGSGATILNTASYLCIRIYHILSLFEDPSVNFERRKILSRMITELFLLAWSDAGPNSTFSFIKLKYVRFLCTPQEYYAYLDVINKETKIWLFSINILSDDSCASTFQFCIRNCTLEHRLQGCTCLSVCPSLQTLLNLLPAVQSSSILSTVKLETIIDYIMRIEFREKW